MSQNKWGFQIKDDNKWVFVATSSGDRYEFDIQGDAYAMSYICFPDEWREQKLDGVKRVRVKEIK